MTASETQQASQTHMTTLAIQIQEFHTTSDITRYWEQLCAAQSEYHIGDDPAEHLDLDCPQSAVIIQNHRKLWLFAQSHNISPWSYIDLHIAFDMSSGWNEDVPPYKTQFGNDFELGITVPAEFTDISYSNDESPSFMC